MKLLAVAALVVAALMLVPAAASAKPCTDDRALVIRGEQYVVGGSANLSCRFMRKWTRRWVLYRDRPAGWRCHRSSSTSGGCNERSGRKRFFVYYPPH